MLRITADGKSLLLEALLLQEMGNSGPLLLWHCRQNFVGGVKVPARS